MLLWEKHCPSLYLSKYYAVILFIDKSQYCFSISIPINFLLNFFAMTPVVPDPTNGSNIESPSFELDKIILLNSSRGFWVGCFPYLFSSSDVSGILQTLLICLPEGLIRSSHFFINS